MLLARIATGVVALAACAWFVFGIRQSHDLNAARAIVTGNTVSRAQAAQAASLLDAASTLNPDSEVKLVRAQLYSRAGQTERAIALAEQVTRAEPRNALAWLGLARVSGSNTDVTVTAFRHIRELSPAVPPAP